VVKLGETSKSRKQFGRRIFSFISRAVLFIISISLFVLALILMKEGAKSLTPYIRNEFSVNSSASALGFGWLTASVALAGSPVAATALALLDANVLSPIETFAMISGSRLGAAFIVLLIGFIYMLRGKQRDLSLSVGLHSLIVTQTIYPIVLLLGFYMLSRGWFQKLQIRATHDTHSPFELLFDPLVHSLERWVPPWLFLIGGFFLILFSLWLFDHILPELHLGETKMGQVHHLLYKPMVTFLLGMVITTLTMSVAVSLSLLVPLSVRGYIRRENVIPYILGANITTFVDTLIAAALLANPIAITVVLVQMVSVAVISIVLLLVGYRLYERFIEYIVNFLGRRRRYLAVYIFVIFLIPFVLLLYG
jgi:solute carrier family 34 (sodium-dependent phosphate cotransporter)